MADPTAVPERKETASRKLVEEESDDDDDSALLHFQGVRSPSSKGVARKPPSDKENDSPPAKVAKIGPRKEAENEEDDSLLHFQAVKSPNNKGVAPRKQQKDTPQKLKKPAQASTPIATTKVEKVPVEETKTASDPIIPDVDQDEVLIKGECA